mmetsp:Transcript_39652/g.64323  ORF Transcript_39652/g.64323 Transcript_39652/m.64323 type:complete len:80 (-) Transcript_39652:126-365(-)
MYTDRSSCHAFVERGDVQPAELQGIDVAKKIPRKKDVGRAEKNTEIVISRTFIACTTPRKVSLFSLFSRFAFLSFFSFL